MQKPVGTSSDKGAASMATIEATLPALSNGHNGHVETVAQLLAQVNAEGAFARAYRPADSDADELISGHWLDGKCYERNMRALAVSCQADAISSLGRQVPTSPTSRDFAWAIKPGYKTAVSATRDCTVV